jgi:hypothetical protein
MLASSGAVCWVCNFLCSIFRNFFKLTSDGVVMSLHLLHLLHYLTDLDEVLYLHITGSCYVNFI